MRERGFFAALLGVVLAGACSDGLSDRVLFGDGGASGDSDVNGVDAGSGGGDAKPVANDATTSGGSSSSSSGGSGSSSGSSGGGSGSSGGSSGGSGSSGFDSAPPTCGPTVAQGTSGNCVVYNDPCPSFGCVMPPNMYWCASNAVPPVAACVAYPLPTQDGGTQQLYCCPTLTCVRFSTDDAQCMAILGLPHTYVCSGSPTGLPTGCKGGSQGIWCCP
jgi:hypothetical protein